MSALAARNEVKTMKGHLDAKQLESMDYKSLQALAKDMGVSAAGKAEDIIARIAAVEVDVPEEDELTDKEKATVAEAAKEEETDEGSEAAKEEEAAAGNDQSGGELVKVAVTEVFLDKTNGKRREAGDVLEVTQERAAELLAAKVAKMTE